MVRRTVCDGEQELMETQMPDADAYRENDTVPVVLPFQISGNRYDPNPLFRRKISGRSDSRAESVLRVWEQQQHTQVAKSDALYVLRPIGGLKREKPGSR